MSSRPLLLCADDFGQSPGISRGIARLAAQGRLGATSCLVNFPGWRADAALLAPLQGLGVGLHFNLTEGAPLSAALAERWPRLPALSTLLALALACRLPMAAVRAEFDAQLAAFVAAWGRAPDHLDGHQHVHHLPGVRELVLEAARRLAPRPAVRATAPLLGPGYGFKRQVIMGTGGRALARALRREGVAHQAALLGAYGFEPQADYRTLMRGWLAQVPAQGALLFCHPGEPGGSDAIALARGRELAYLASDDFAADLRAARVRLVSGSGAATAPAAQSVAA